MTKKIQTKKKIIYSEFKKRNEEEREEKQREPQSIKKCGGEIPNFVDILVTERRQDLC